MPEIRKNIKVFLGSPGDLSDERKAAKAAVDELNTILATNLGYQIELIGWEDTVSIFGRPQEIINRELDRCDIFVGLMWKRWGTPPDNTGMYTSGFEEEFRRSLSRRENKGRPEMSMFFKEIDVELLRDPGPGLSQVLKFRDELIAGKKILFENFVNSGDFEKKLRRCLSAYVFRLRDAEIDAIIDSNLDQKPEPSKNENENKTEENSNIISMIGEEMGFLATFLKRKDGKKDASHVSPIAVARLRLLTAAVRTAENDPDSLGVHDINLLYLERSAIKFSNRENSELLSAGLEHFSNENSPIWCWYKNEAQEKWNEIGLYTLVGTQTSRVNTFKLMKLLKLKNISRENFGTKCYIDRWFGSNVPALIRNETLIYLSECGDEKDLPKIIEEIEKHDTQTENQAILSLVYIKLKSSREEALQTINEYQPSSIPNTLVGKIFNDSKAIGIVALQAALNNKNQKIRNLAINTIAELKKVTHDLAIKLIEDSNPRLRYWGLKYFVSEGRNFTEDQIEKILCPPTKSEASLFVDQTPGQVLELFRSDNCQEMPLKLLEPMTKDLSIHYYAPFFIYVWRSFNKEGGKLRNSIENKFENEYEAWISRIQKLAPGDNQFIESIRSYSDFSKFKLVRQGLNVIVEKFKLEDLDLVRKTLSSASIKWNYRDTNYLAKFGEWRDISNLIIGYNNWEVGTEFSLSELVSQNHASHISIAGAIYEIGKERFQEVVEMEMSPKLKATIIWLCSDKNFVSLPDDLVMSLFSNENELVRKAAVLKSIAAFSNKKNKWFLNAYLKSGPQRYYNVIHWFDLSDSLPRVMSTLAVKQSFNDLICGSTA